MKKKLTAEQEAARAAKRERFQAMIKKIAAMPDAERASLASQCGAVVTCEGRALSVTHTQPPAAGEAEHTLHTLKIDEAADLPLAIIEDTEDGEGVCEMGDRTPRNLANAAFIVRACNSHAELTANLQAERLAKARLLMQNAKLVAALEHARNNMGHPDQMIDDALAVAKEGRT